MEKMFLPFGKIISSSIFRDRTTLQSKGFGFVSYDNPTSAQEAIKAMNGFHVGEKWLKVQLKRPKDRVPWDSPIFEDCCDLFIFHLPNEYGDEELEKLFLPFGKIVSSSVFMDNDNGRSKGFGFVSFDNPSSAREAIKALNGCKVGEKWLKVEFKGNRPRRYDRLVWIDCEMSGW